MVRFRSFYFCFSLLLIVEFQQEKALYKRNAGNVKVVALIAPEEVNVKVIFRFIIKVRPH